MCVIQHIYIIAILFNFISEISNKVIAAIQPLFTRLTNEIQSLRKEFHASKKEKKENKNRHNAYTAFQRNSAVFRI